MGNNRVPAQQMGKMVFWGLCISQICGTKPCCHEEQGCPHTDPPSRTPDSRERSPASETRVRPRQQPVRLLQMPRIALNDLTHSGPATIARNDLKEAAKLLPKLGKTHPTATLLLTTEAANSATAQLCLGRLSWKCSLMLQPRGQHPPGLTPRLGKHHPSILSFKISPCKTAVSTASHGRDKVRSLGMVSAFCVSTQPLAHRHASGC